MFLIFIMSAAVLMSLIGLTVYLLVSYRNMKEDYNPELSNMNLEKYGDELFIYDKANNETLIHF
jgi:heme/copper-type cytochrome/quinol oxidase subunit 2